MPQFDGPMSLAEFMNHDPSGRGGRTNYLRGWTKRTPPQVDVWLHTRAAWAPLWQHGGLQQVREIEDRETKVRRREIWGLKFNCLEPESVLKEQYSRDRDSGIRKIEPTICPVCKMNEYLYQLMLSGALDVTQAIFDFQVDEKREVLTLGAMLGEFPKWGDMDDAMKKRVSEAKINLKDSWKHKAIAKCNYVFCVVDNSQPQNGCQVAIETGLLGQKLKAELQKEIERRGTEEGNPLIKPYPFRWKYFAQEAEFNKKYDVVALSNVQITEDIQRMIVEEAPPDLARVCRPGDVRSLRAQLEQYAVLELPFDDFFAEAEALQARAADADTEFPYGANAGGDEELPAEAGTVEDPAPAAPPPPPARKPVPTTARAAAAPPARAPAASPAPAAKPATAVARVAPTAKPPVPPPKQAATPPAAKPAAKPSPVAPGRKKVEPPPPSQPLKAGDPCPPGWEPCVDCNTPMAPEMVECPGCGTRYAPVDGAGPTHAAAPVEEPAAPSEGELKDIAEGETGTDEIPW